MNGNDDDDDSGRNEHETVREPIDDGRESISGHTCSARAFQLNLLGVLDGAVRPEGWCIRYIIIRRWIVFPAERRNTTGLTGSSSTRRYIGWQFDTTWQIWDRIQLKYHRRSVGRMGEGSFYKRGDVQGRWWSNDGCFCWNNDRKCSRLVVTYRSTSGNENRVKRNDLFMFHYRFFLREQHLGMEAKLLSCYFYL